MAVNMMDKYCRYIYNQDFVAADPNLYWDPARWDQSPALFWDPQNARGFTLRSTASQILHELGHNLALPHTNNGAKWPYCDVSCNLMNNVGGDKALNHQQVRAIHKALSVTDARNYVDGCPISPHPIEITTDETWDFDIRLYQDLHIKSGNTLTLTCQLSMPADAKIIVEQGARLIVDGGTITNACDGQAWQGIEVWGTPNQPHPSSINSLADMLNATTLHQGIVIAMDGAIIENANQAIVTKDGSGGSFGGIIYADNASFLNNRKAIEFMSYSSPNVSYFNNCDFTTSQVLSNADAFVTLWEVEGLTFYECSFQNTNSAQSTPRGISSIDASFTVDQSSFTNMDRGVVTMGTVGNLAQVEVIGAYDGFSDPANNSPEFKNMNIGI